jgi:hypothetical protein
MKLARVRCWLDDNGYDGALFRIEESERMSVLGSDCATALESALLTWHPDERECDLAARIAAALEERLVYPSVLLAGGEERRRTFRHPVVSSARTGRDVLAVAVVSEPKGRGAGWTEERRRSDEGRQHLAAPRRRASGNRDTFVVGADGPVPITNTANWPVVAGGASGHLVRLIGKGPL